MSKPDDLISVSRLLIEEIMHELRRHSEEDNAFRLMHALEVKLEEAAFVRMKRKGKIYPLLGKIKG